MKTAMTGRQPVTLVLAYVNVSYFVRFRRFQT